MGNFLNTTVQSQETVKNTEEENTRRRLEEEANQRRKEAEAIRQRIAEKQRIEEENTRIRLEEEANQRRKEAEDVRLQQEAAKKEKSILLDNLLSSIDLYIRTRDQFNSKKPSQYQCNLNSIKNDLSVVSQVKQLNKTNEILKSSQQQLVDIIQGFRDNFKINNLSVRVSTLTPYQGDEYVYGYFKCPTCLIEWESGHSWMDDHQDCQQCKGLVYPFKQESNSLKINQLKRQLSDDIDCYIRTRRRFNSSTPWTYKCGISAISSDPDVSDSLADLNTIIKITLSDFIKRQHRFLIKSNDNVIVRYLTPFRAQDSHRLFGEFQCSNCIGQWYSSSTWTEKWQMCKRCNTKSYPSIQHQLDRNDSEDDIKEKRPHHQLRCEKCQELGRLCVPREYYSVD